MMETSAESANDNINLESNEKLNESDNLTEKALDCCAEIQTQDDTSALMKLAEIACISSDDYNNDTHTSNKDDSFQHSTKESTDIQEVSNVNDIPKINQSSSHLPENSNKVDSNDIDLNKNTCETINTQNDTDISNKPTCSNNKDKNAENNLNLPIDSDEIYLKKSGCQNVDSSNNSNKLDDIDNEISNNENNIKPPVDINEMDLNKNICDNVTSPNDVENSNKNKEISRNENNLSKTKDTNEIDLMERDCETVNTQPVKVNDSDENKHVEPISELVEDENPKHHCQESDYKNDGQNKEDSDGNIDEAISEGVEDENPKHHRLESDNKNDQQNKIDEYNENKLLEPAHEIIEDDNVMDHCKESDKVDDSDKNNENKLDEPAHEIIEDKNAMDQSDSENDKRNKVEKYDENILDEPASESIEDENSMEHCHKSDSERDKQNKVDDSDDNKLDEPAHEIIEDENAMDHSNESDNKNDKQNKVDSDENILDAPVSESTKDQNVVDHSHQSDSKIEQGVKINSVSDDSTGKQANEEAQNEIESKPCQSVHSNLVIDNENEHIPSSSIRTEVQDDAEMEIDSSINFGNESQPDICVGQIDSLPKHNVESCELNSTESKSKNNSIQGKQISDPESQSEENSKEGNEATIKLSKENSDKNVKDSEGIINPQTFTNEEKSQSEMTTKKHRKRKDGDLPPAKRIKLSNSAVNDESDLEDNNLVIADNESVSPKLEVPGQESDNRTSEDAVEYSTSYPETSVDPKKEPNESPSESVSEIAVKNIQASEDSECTVLFQNKNSVNQKLTDVISKKYVCLKCQSIWNDSMLRKLFEGNQSVTVNSRITYGAIICMIIFAGKNYPGTEEDDLIALLERADLAKNLGSFQISSLGSLLIYMLKCSSIKCCEPFKLIYRAKTDKKRVSLPSNEALAKEISWQSELDLPKSTSSVSRFNTPDLDENQTNNLDSITIDDSVTVQIEQDIAKCKIISLEKKSITKKFHFVWDMMEHKRDMTEEEAQNMKFNNMTKDEAQQIHSLFIYKSLLVDSVDYFEFFFQLLFHRGYILLIPDAKALVKYGEQVRKEDNVDPFSTEVWDQSFLYSAPIPDSEYSEDHIPTVKEILSVFCRWRNRSFLSETVFIHGNLRQALTKIFPKNIHIEDCLGLCIKLYSSYCNFLFYNYQPYRAQLFLDLHYLPQKDLDSITNKIVLEDNLKFLPPSHKKVYEVIKYFEDKNYLENFKQIKTVFPKSLIDRKIEVAKQMKSGMLSHIKSSKISQLVEEYAQLKFQVNYFKS